MPIRANSITSVSDTRSHREVSTQRCTHPPATTSCQKQAGYNSVQVAARRDRCTMCKGLLLAALHVPSGQQVCLQIAGASQVTAFYRQPGRNHAPGAPQKLELTSQTPAVAVSRCSAPVPCGPSATSCRPVRAYPRPGVHTF